MIRKYESTDENAVIAIWLEASILAHDFISADYWRSKTDDMRRIYLPTSLTYVYVNKVTGDVIGFISMVDNYLAAIFISPAYQGKGIGRQLINYIKGSYKEITLAVFKRNVSSVAFYEKQGFQLIEERAEEHTKHTELIMGYHQ